MKVKVINLNNKAAGEVELADAVFGAPVRADIMHRAVRWQLAKRQAGTHSSKTVGEISGTTRKPWKQKGTGRARAGSIRSPLWKKGGVTFGPQPRDYEQSFPKKKRRGALKMVLSDKLRNQKLTVIDDFSLESHRTKEFLAVLEKFKLEEKILGKSFLILFLTLPKL